MKTSTLINLAIVFFALLNVLVWTYPFNLLSSLFSH
jgi:hypothetical protein